MHRKQIDGTFMLCRCEKRPPRRMPNPAAAKSWQLRPMRQNRARKKCVASILAGDAFGLQVVGLEPSLNVEDRALSCSGKCASERKDARSERGGLCQRTVGKHTKVNLLRGTCPHPVHVTSPMSTSPSGEGGVGEGGVGEKPKNADRHLLPILQTLGRPPPEGLGGRH